MDSIIIVIIGGILAIGIDLYGKAQAAHDHAAEAEDNNTPKVN